MPHAATAPAVGPPAGGLATREALTAMLRWRLRALPAAVPPRSVRAARLAATLFHGSYPGTRLDGDAPGVSGLRYRRAWKTLAAEFSLPPPSRAQRGEPMVEAVLAVPRRERLAILAVTAGLKPADLEVVSDRAVAIQDHLVGAGADVLLRVIDAERFARDPDSHRAFAFGALCAGRLSSVTWSALEAAATLPLSSALIAELAADSTDPLATLALALLGAAPAPGPLAAAIRLLRREVSARLLADPGELCTRWAAMAGCHPEDLHAALALARPPRPARPPPRGGVAPPPAPAAPEGAGAGEVVTLGARLALAAARALRAEHGPGAVPVRAWRDAVGPGIPRALLPALGRRLGAAGQVRTRLVEEGGIHEVRLPDGVALGRGTSQVQARVRALSLLASAALDAVVEHAEQPWRAVAARLARPPDRRTLLLAVEPAAPSGPPHDPLNRGPDRAIGFPGALAIRLTPGGRASARVLTGEETVQRAVREAVAGNAVVIVAARAEAHPVAARLQGVTTIVQAAPGGRPVALEAGGRVLLVAPDRLRRFGLERFTARPRVFVPDPDAPDLSLAPGDRRKVGLSGRSVIECRAALGTERRAVLVYADAAGGHLREQVPLAELEEHLRDTRALLQASDPEAILAVRLSEDVEPALRRVPSSGPPVLVHVAGVLPWGLELSLEGDVFGGRTGRTWREAARAALAWWPRGGARLSVNSVTARAGRRSLTGLPLLWVRSFVVRRLRTHLLHELRAYQGARSSRSER
jgi:hypothetical protein